MTYSETWPEIITHDEMVYEVDQHDGDGIADFYEEYGHKTKYKSKDVLAWLGY